MAGRERVVARELEGGATEGGGTVGGLEGVAELAGRDEVVAGPLIVVEEAVGELD